MSDEQKSFLKDLLKSEGWKILEAYFHKAADERRRLATQRPTAVAEAERTWYAAEASGIEEVLDGAHKLAE